MIAKPDGVGRDTTRGSILVVDDDASNRKLLKTLLATLGVPVIERDGGQSALDLLATPHHDVELVILDMMMPLCDGMQVLNTLAARSVTPGLPVLVVTAHDDRELRRRALAAGAIDFITKPVDRVEFQAKCTTMLELSHLRAVLEERDFLNQERLAAVVGNAPSAISVRDAQARYTLVNEAFCELFGQCSVAEVIGRTESEILPPDTLERSQQANARLLSGEGFVEEESITRGQDTIAVLTQRFPLKDAGGTISEVVAIRTDITQRKEYERKLAERAMWSERVSAAIGDGRLLVYAQPIVNIADRKVIEDELLVRLEDATTGEISAPSGFLPQCEEHRLLPVIDRYMVDRAIALAATGRRVCVNITGQTIGDTSVMGEIFQALTIAGPEITGRILFEITETTALASPETAQAFSSSIRTLGCRVALDDFGTGYGTFTELRNLELDELKIDRSFVQNMIGNPDDQRVVTTIAFVAREYGLTTVAEGVDSEATLERLAELEVDRAQGYLFGRPAPVVG